MDQDLKLIGLCPANLGFMTLEYTDLHPNMCCLFSAIIGTIRSRKERRKLCIFEVVKDYFCADLSVLLLQQLQASNSSSIEAGELCKLVLKTFWSTIYMGVPKILLEEAQFTGWMTVLYNFLSKPVPQVCQDLYFLIPSLCYLRSSSMLSFQCSFALWLLWDDYCPVSLLECSAGTLAVYKGDLCISRARHHNYFKTLKIF